MQKSLIVRPYKPGLGAWIEHCDLSQPQSVENHALLNQALIEHGVLFFRGQHLGAAQQLEAARLFGEPLRKNIYLDAHPDQPEIEVIEHSGKTGSGGTDNWHIDVSWQPAPPKATLLHAVEIPDNGGGDTLWVSATGAYSLLDPDLARYFEKLRAVHTFLVAPKRERLTDLLQGYRANPQQQTAEQHQARLASGLQQYPPIEVPVIKTHPQNGRKMIFVNEGHTSHLLGVSRTASQGLLNLLFDLLKTPEIQLRHSWQQGDVAIWDNRQVQHYAVRDYGPARRRIHRVTLAHDGVF